MLPLGGQKLEEAMDGPRVAGLETSPDSFVLEISHARRESVLFERDMRGSGVGFKFGPGKDSRAPPNGFDVGGSVMGSAARSLGLVWVAQVGVLFHHLEQKALNEVRDGLPALAPSKDLEPGDFGLVEELDQVVLLVEVSGLAIFMGERGR